MVAAEIHPPSVEAEGGEGRLFAMLIFISLTLHMLVITVGVWWNQSQTIKAPSVFAVQLVGNPGSPNPGRPALAPDPAPEPKPEPKPEVKKPKPKPEPKVEKPKPKPEPKAEPKPKETIDRRERINRPRSIDSILNNYVKSQDRIEEEIEEELNPPEPEPRGGGGGGTQVADPEFVRYQNQLWALVKDKWVIPAGLLDAARGKTAVIAVRVAADGEILHHQFKQGTGIPELDNSAERAIKRMGRFPPVTFDMGGAAYVTINLHFQAN